MREVSPDRKKIVIDWLEIPAGEQTETAKQLRERLSLGYQAFNLIQREWKYQKEYNARKDRETRKIQGILEKGLGGESPPIEVTIGGRRAVGRVDLNKVLQEVDEPQMPESEEEQIKEVLDALWAMSVARRNVFASKIWLQAKGQLVEKREEKITFVSADDIARQQFEAGRRLREIGRVVNVPAKRSLLSDPARSDNQQEHGKDSKVGSVGLPT